MDFSKKPSDPCAIPAPRTVPRSRQGMQESWRFTCAEKLKIINGLLALVIKVSLCCNTGCSHGDQSFLHMHNQGEVLPRARRRAGCGRGCRGAEGWGAVPGQSCAGALTPHVQLSGTAFVPVMMWECHSSLFWISTGGLRSDRSSLHDCRRCKTAQDPDLISAVFYPTK